MDSFETTYSSLKQNYERELQCSLTDDSDSGVKLKVIASEFFALYDKLEFIKNQMFPTTADSLYLQKHGELRGVIKKQATKSVGKVNFQTATPATADIFIPKGTLCTSSKGSGLVFKTISDNILLANTTFIACEVESIEVGSKNNIAPFYIDILVNSIAGISRVFNSASTSGGADIEDDNVYRSRVIEAYNKISNGANLNFYEQYAKSLPDVLFAKAIYTKDTINKIELYVENSTRTITDAAIANVQEKINSVRELGVGVTVKRPNLKTIPLNILLKTDTIANRSTCKFEAEQMIENYISSLSIGQRFSVSILAKALLSINGLKDVIFNSPTTTVTPLPSEIPSLGTITMTIEKE